MTSAATQEHVTVPSSLALNYYLIGWLPDRFGAALGQVSPGPSSMEGTDASPQGAGRV